MHAIRVTALLAAILFVTACVSLPPPERGTKTLLVVPLEASAGAPLSGEDLWIGLKGMESSRLLKSSGAGLCVFRDLAPGTYTMDRMGRMHWKAVAGALFGSPSEPWPIDPVNFTLTEGEITILPVSVSLTKESPWVKLVETNRDEVLAKLAALKNFDSWKVAP